jgi:Rieske Fe-S protein
MDNRLVYRVVLKLLFILALAVLTMVFINSLFTTPVKKTTQSKSVPYITVDLSTMNKGDVKKIRWDGKEVAVLYRKGTPFFYHTKYIAKIPHKSLNSGFRSIKKDYFVYLNHGDSGNCPLFNERDALKDVCTGTKFDTSGRVKGREQQGYLLKIPPHKFSGEWLIIGEWQVLK